MSVDSSNNAKHRPQKSESLCNYQAKGQFISLKKIECFKGHKTLHYERPGTAHITFL